MNEILKTRVTFTMTVKPGELKVIRDRAERMRLPIARLMVLGAINWDGNLKA
jgi:hypothetical protein